MLLIVIAVLRNWQFTVQFLHFPKAPILSPTIIVDVAAPKWCLLHPVMVVGTQGQAEGK